MPLTLSEKLNPHQPFKIAYITWNIANSVPTRQEVEEILNVYEGEVDVIIVAEQEGPRSTTHSLGTQIACQLKNVKKNNKETLRGYIGNHREKYETFTGWPGSVASTMISNHPIIISASGAVRDQENSNKGGVYQTVSIGCQTFQTVNVHLESFSNQRRMIEVNSLMAVLTHQKIIQDFKILAKIAATPIIFGGDFNMRDLLKHYPSKRPVISDLVNPENSEDKPVRYFCLHGLHNTKPRKAGEITYADKYTHCQDIPIIPDQKRLGAVKRGVLDIVSVRGSQVRVLENKIIKNTITGDHKPVVAVIEIPKISNAFKLTQSFISDMIENLHITPKKKIQFEKIKSFVACFSNTENNKKILCTLYAICQNTLIKYLGFEQTRIAALENREKLKKDIYAEQMKEKPCYRSEPVWKMGLTEKIKKLEGALLTIESIIRAQEEQLDLLEDKFIQKMNELCQLASYKKITSETQTLPLQEFRTSCSPLSVIDAARRINLRLHSKGENPPSRRESFAKCETPTLYSKIKRDTSGIGSYNNISYQCNFWKRAAPLPPSRRLFAKNT